MPIQHIARRVKCNSIVVKSLPRVKKYRAMSSALRNFDRGLRWRNVNLAIQGTLLTMRPPLDGSMSDPLDEWRSISDAYAASIEALALGEPGAAIEAMRLSLQLQQCAGAQSQLPTPEEKS